MSKLNQDQELMSSILAKEWHTLYAEEIILVMNYAKEQQAKIDELRKENAALVHVIKSRDIQLENEKHEYDELESKLVDSKMKNTKLQKRVDAVKQLIEEYRDPPTEDKTFQHALSIVADELEQSLKGVEE